MAKAFPSPLGSTQLAVTSARASVARAGLTRCSFVPEDTDHLTLPGVGDEDYYAQRERLVDVNPHTVVEP